MKDNKYQLSLTGVIICIVIASAILFAMFGPHQLKEVDKNTTQKVVEPAKFGKVLYYPAEVEPMIKRHEGVRDTVYPDTEGIPTIGVGFNLLKKNARQRIKNVGADYNSILDGTASLTQKQIEDLFQVDMAHALSDAQDFLPNLNQYPREVKIVVINMSYNLGLPRLNTFVKFRQALINKHYGKAAYEMVNSKWYRQVGDRSKELVNIMRNV